MANLFVAKFSEVDNVNGKFKADKNGNLPFIGEVVAGTAVATLLNGSQARTRGIEPHQLYLCENTKSEFVNPNTGEVQEGDEVTVIAKVSTLELIQLRKELGSPRFVRNTQEDSEDVEEPKTRKRTTPIVEGEPVI